MKLVIASCAAALLAATAAVPAVAAEPLALAKAIAQVKTSDLDLTSPDGQSNLEKRINRATRNVCALDKNGQVRGRTDEVKCRLQTLAALKAHFSAGG